MKKVVIMLAAAFLFVACSSSSGSDDSAGLKDSFPAYTASGAETADVSSDDALLYAVGYTGVSSADFLAYCQEIVADGWTLSDDYSYEALSYYSYDYSKGTLSLSVVYSSEALTIQAYDTTKWAD